MSVYILCVDIRKSGRVTISIQYTRTTFLYCAGLLHDGSVGVCYVCLKRETHFLFRGDF